MKKAFLIIGGIIILIIITIIFTGEEKKETSPSPQRQTVPAYEQEEGEPTAKEMEIYDLYWKKLDEAGNPREYINHPTNIEASNKWEKAKMQQVLNIYNISYDELFDIVIKVSFWKMK